MEYDSKSVLETEKIAKNLAKRIVSQKNVVPRNTRDKAIVIALEGELGAGKTTFVKAFARALGVKQKLSSPTFVLMRHYKLEISDFKLLIHLDAYRLRDYRDLSLLGIEEILKNPENIVLIEWSDRVNEIIPKDAMKVLMDHVGENRRRIIISNFS